MAGEGYNAEMLSGASIFLSKYNNLEYDSVKSVINSL